MLVDSLENWWFDFSKCLLVGELCDLNDVKLLNCVTSNIVGLLKKLKRSISLEEESWIKLLVSCHCYLSHQQLVRGLMKVLNVTARNPLLVEVLNFFKSVESQLENFKNAKRNPVILVLDKVTF